MSICKFTEGSESDARRIGDVTISRLKLFGVEQLKIHDHSLCFYTTDESYSTEKWEGQTLPRKHWTIGAAGFIPANSELSSRPDFPFQKNWIRFHAPSFKSATDGLIHPDQIDFRFADIGDPEIFGLAKVVGGLADVPEIEQWPVLIESASLALAVSIIKKLAKPGALAAIDKPFVLCDTRIKRVTEFVEANLGKRISLHDMAEIAALSQYHFSRQFTLKVGVSPLRYVMQRRIEMAKRELVRPRANLAEVAYACGFGGQSHFTTTFRTVVGVTPGEYRRGHGLPEHGTMLIPAA